MEKAYKLNFMAQPLPTLTVNCCGLSRTEPLHSFGPAIKPHYLIHYVISGKGVFSINGQTYPLGAGYGFMIPPDELAFYQADETDPWTYVWVGFNGSDAEVCLAEMGITLNNPVFYSEKEQEIYHAVKDMMEHNTWGLSNELRRSGQLNLFLSLLAGESEPTMKEEADRSNGYVSKAISFIQNNYCNPIRVTDIADYVCINRSYLYSLFQQSIGMSPQQFLTTFRLTKATELLQRTDFSIESIGLSCGYTDPLVFSKAFRQMKGMSPSVYRKEIRSGSSRRRKEDLEQVEAFIEQINRVSQSGHVTAGM